MKTINIEEKIQQFKKIKEEMTTWIIRAEGTFCSIEKNNRNDQEFLLKLDAFKQQANDIINTLNTSITNADKALLILGIKDYSTFSEEISNEEKNPIDRSNDNSDEQSKYLLVGFWKSPEVSQLKHFRYDFHELLSRTIQLKHKLQEKLDACIPSLKETLGPLRN